MKYKLENKILDIKNLKVAYGDNVILQDINLEEFNITTEGEHTGQFIAVLGLSGRGKSTFFKAITGLIKPTEGQVLISDNYALNQAKIVHEGDVGFVDQKYTLFRHKTITQTLRYALRNEKLTREQEDIKIAQFLVDWSLFPHKDKYPCELSGGQRQRTAILEQLLTSGRYIVFDEPASGLDVLNIKKLKQSFNMISKQNDLNTVIFSTHDINLAVELADSIYIIGHKNPEDTVSTLLKNYDLKKMGLAWQEFGLGHVELVKEITSVLEQS